MAVADLDAVDHGGVEQLAGSWVGVAVGGGAVGGEPPGGLEDGLPLVQVGSEGAAADIEGGGPLADSGLFLAEQAQVDGVGVVGRQQLATLALQAQQFTVKLLVLLGGVALAGSDLGLEGGVQLAKPVVGELDSLVELLDLVFQPVGGDVGLLAAATAGGAGAEAVEVGVAAAVVAGGDQIGVAAATDRAVQHPFEVVMVLAFAGAPGRAGGQQVLDLLEQLGADQWLVLALDQDPVPVDQPHVGLVGQQLSHAAEAERLGWVVAAAAVAQPAGGQLGGEPLQGPVAAGIQLEGGADVVGAVGVGLDAGDQPPADGSADVAVAQGGLVGPAALFGFLGHALADLGGQIRRVELGHQGVDAFGEAALGAVIQGLDHADQLDPEAAEQGADGDVVFEVAGEPVHLMNHHHLHVAVALDAGQHGLELGPVGGAGALTPLDVLPNDGDGVVGGVAGAGFALGGEGQAVLVEALVDLAAGGHP